MDTQQIEVIGRCMFIAEAVKHGFEVAMPERDSGCDLILYVENPRFAAVPVQLKVNSEKQRRWGLHTKYEGKDSLLIVNVWLPREGDSLEILLMTYAECLEILGTSAETASWTEKGSYSCRVGPTKLDQLGKFRNRWGWLRQQLTVGAV